MNNSLKSTCLQNKSFANIDSLRFLFSILIVYFHILHSNILKFCANTNMANFYYSLCDKCTDGYLIVECFFIIGGFFLFETFKNNKNLSFAKFVARKIIRLWPVLAFSILITICANFLNIAKTNIYTQFINLFFLQCIGISLDYKGINWYVSPFFWTIVFYFYILKNFSAKQANLIIALCIYFSLVGNLNHFDGSFGRETFNTFFNSGVLRALSGLGIGYFIGIFYNKIKDRIKEKFNKIGPQVVFSFMEILCFFFLANHFVFNKIAYKNKLIFILFFSILFLLFLLKKGILSRFLENKFMAYFGKYSYSIYIMQQISFGILGFTLWKHSKIILQPILCISISIAFSILVGILTYYLIERPSFEYLNKKFAEFMKK